MQSDRFQGIARHLIKHYRGESQGLAGENHPVYLLTFDINLDIHVIGSQPGYLNLVATFPAPGHWLTLEGLRALLAENIFSLEHPFPILGMDARSGKMAFSLRQPLEELNDNTALSLFEAFVQRAMAYHSGQILPPTQTATEPSPHGSHQAAQAAMAVKNQSVSN